MAANVALIVKITNGTEIRRFTAQADSLSWTSLSKQSAELFNIALSCPRLLSVVRYGPGDVEI